MPIIKRMRSNGDSTLIDIEVKGKLRTVSVSREAIEDAAGLTPELAAVQSAKTRTDWVVANIDRVSAAASRKLAATNPAADLVMIGTFEL